VIEYRQGDLLAADSEAVVNTVNCVGAMGRGIALQFKKRVPDNYAHYEAACKRGEVAPGRMLVFETKRVLNPKYIVNFPTKRHWRGASRMEDVEAGLADLVGVIQSLDIKSISIPPLGCGLGGLDWPAVRERMEKAFAAIPDVAFHLFEPMGAPPAGQMANNRAAPKMTSGRAALVSLTKRYLDGLLDPVVTLLEIHKLMYFLQESGEPLRLDYVKAPHGPYAQNLRHVLNAIEGHLLLGYADGGDRRDKQIQIVPGAEADAAAYLERCPETSARIGRVAALVEGFESPFGMELLSTVHWVMTKEAAAREEVIDFIYKWGPQKKKFSPRQIGVAVERLEAMGWVGV
jgi:O-acetyl-ADP-ribose deacetylase (regulator of RNase III)